MKLFIDNIEADFSPQKDFHISIDPPLSHEDIDSRAQFKTIELAATKRNREIIGDIDQPFSVTLFNNMAHNARIEKQGVVLFQGVIMIEKVEQNRCYTMRIVSEPLAWVEAAKAPFRKIPLIYSVTLSPGNIIASWSEDTPLRFLPVQRDSYLTDAALSKYPFSLTSLTYKDYHPFVSIKSLFEAIFSSAGYTISSSFTNTPLFKSLMISGAYTSLANVDRAVADMNFLAGRTSEKSATADHLGRVYADPYTTTSSIGNIVESANPSLISGAFTINNCFYMDGSRIAFKPIYEVSVSMRYALRYTTSYVIASRDSLKGFNRFGLTDGQEYSITLTNDAADRREAPMVANKKYLIVAFSQTQASRRTYQLRYTVSGASKQLTLPAMGNNGYVTTSTSDAGGTNMQLWYKEGSSSTYIKYNEDWAMYDGDVTYRGTRRVEIELTEQATKTTPGKVKYFDRIYFGGADSGMTLTIDKSTTITPVFEYYPGQGSTIKIEDVIAHNISQMDFLKAIGHLFNLRFYTDNVAKVVYIEPSSDLHTQAPVVDWSDKILFEHPITIEQIGGDKKQTITYQYRSGDASVTRFNQQSGSKYGEWSVTNTASYHPHTSYISQNPLLRPSMSVQNKLPYAKSAFVLQVGDRDYTLPKAILNFPPKIVSYQGIKELPANEKWSWPSNKQSYPEVIFSAPQRANLCFEERHSQPGLHIYYDNDIQKITQGKRVSLLLKLTPADIEPLLYPSDYKRDMRAKYLLNIAGERGLFTIEKITNYNPETQIARVSLITL